MNPLLARTTTIDSVWDLDTLTVICTNAITSRGTQEPDEEKTREKRKMYNFTLEEAFRRTESRWEK